MAALGLVHDVGGDQQGGAAVGGEGVEELPQVAAQDGVEADGGLVEDQQFRGAEERDREGDPAALAAGEVPGEGVGVGGEVHVGDGAFDVLVPVSGGGPAGVEDRREVGQVLSDRQVVVDGGVLGDVADAGAQGGVARGAAEHLQGAGDLGLGADDRAHQGGLAAARGAQQSGDLAVRHGEVEALEDLAGAAHDAQPGGPDGGGSLGGGPAGRVIHHAMNNAPGRGVRQVRKAAQPGRGRKGWEPVRGCGAGMRFRRGCDCGHRRRSRGYGAGRAAGATRRSVS